MKFILFDALNAMAVKFAIVDIDVLDAFDVFDEFFCSL